MHLAIDPGADTGWALFGEANQLVECGLLPSKNFHNLPLYLSGQRAWVECPRLRPREVNPNSILTLARTAGECAGLLRARGMSVTYVTPNDWKGSTRKETSHQRILARLSAGETQILALAFRDVAKSKQHNVLDAVGIGLYAAGRR